MCFTQYILTILWYTVKRRKNMSQHGIANEKVVVLDLWSKSLYTGGEQLGSF